MLSNPKEVAFWVRGLFLFFRRASWNLEAIDILSPEYHLGFTPLFPVILQTCVIHQLGRGREGKEKNLQMILSFGPLYCQEGGKGPKVLADFFPQTFIDNCLTV